MPGHHAPVRIAHPRMPRNRAPIVPTIPLSGARLWFATLVTFAGLVAAVGGILAGYALFRLLEVLGVMR